jgi:hypothetical protein
MTVRRRKILIVAALLMAGAALMWWFGRGGGRSEVKLEFVGYTNIAPGNYLALVLATNTGTVPIKLTRSFRQETLDKVEDDETVLDHLAFPLLSASQRIVNPEQGVLLYLMGRDFRAPWNTEIGYQRHGFRERLKFKAESADNSPLQWIAHRIFSSPPEVWVKLGPITNLAPESSRPMDWE